MEEKKEDELRIASIRIPLSAGPNELLTLLMPNITIHGLTEIVPSMNDIFIQTVTGKIN